MKSEKLIKIRSNFGRLLHRKHHLLREPNNGTVIISRSKDIFANLALEEWLFKNARFDRDSYLLLMWTNGPTVVCGRHQNPWNECRLRECAANDVSVARRQSGGGTVYHDFNNLNVSFFSNKSRYNRTNNLSLIQEMLKACFKIDCSISPREDLVLTDCGSKISGTASKLAHSTAYHHCTLLVDVDLRIMRKVIRKENNYGNIFEVYADEVTFPGINTYIENLKSWEWIFGKTPKFTLKFPVNNSPAKCKLDVFKGVIDKIEVEPNLFGILPHLQSVRFTIEDINLHLNKWIEFNNHSGTNLALLHTSIIDAVNSIY
ncbi:hypothetical protein B4U79_14684, partial [Dinothrombium tinctorium]